MLPFLLQNRLDIASFLTKPLQPIRYEVQVLAALAPKKDDSVVVRVLRKSFGVTGPAHVTRVPQCVAVRIGSARDVANWQLAVVSTDWLPTFVLAVLNRSLGRIDIARKKT